MCARRACRRFERKTAEFVFAFSERTGAQKSTRRLERRGVLSEGKNIPTALLVVWKRDASLASRPGNMHRRRVIVKREPKTVDRRQTSRCVFLRQATETLGVSILRMHAHPYRKADVAFCAGVAPQAFQGRVGSRRCFAPQQQKNQQVWVSSVVRPSEQDRPNREVERLGSHRRNRPTAFAELV